MFTSEYPICMPTIFPPSAPLQRRSCSSAQAQSDHHSPPAIPPAHPPLAPARSAPARRHTPDRATRSEPMSNPALIRHRNRVAARERREHHHAGNARAADNHAAPSTFQMQRSSMLTLPHAASGGRAEIREQGERELAICRHIHGKSRMPPPPPPPGAAPRTS